MIMNKLDIQVEALDRARHGQTLTNYPAIYQGFIAKDIPEADIKPRENVFTFHAWKALGRSVKRGEHGVKIITFIERTREKDDGTTEIWRQPWTSTVFHISQTELSAAHEAGRELSEDDRINAGLQAERAARDRRRAQVAANWGPCWN
jgi:hypothetical protein